MHFCRTDVISDVNNNLQCLCQWNVSPFPGSLLFVLQRIAKPSLQSNLCTETMPNRLIFHDKKRNSSVPLRGLLNLSPTWERSTDLKIIFPLYLIYEMQLERTNWMAKLRFKKVSVGKLFWNLSVLIGMVNQNFTLNTFIQSTNFLRKISSLKF